MMFLAYTTHKSHAQARQQDDFTTYIIPELTIGSIVPNYLNFPKYGPRIGVAVSLLRQSTKVTPTNQYYNFPLLGIQAGFHRLGNPYVFGNELNLMPIIGLRTKKGLFQWGIGASYFTKTNLQSDLNKAIGSHLNWAFQWMYYRNINFTENSDLRIGFGYHHSSNGHTQLPNYGINSAVLSIGLIPEMRSPPKTDRTTVSKQRNPFILARVGIGFHEFGGTTFPIGGPKKAVFTQSIAGGVTFKQHFRWYAGLGSRHYQHYADSIRNSPQLQELNISPKNYFFMMGVEYMIYHVGISIEGGINLYKPFYPHFAAEFEKVAGIKYTLKRIFPSRMGLRFYLINQAKQPKHNLFIAAHINANFGQADFSEASLGYVYKLK